MTRFSATNLDLSRLPPPQAIRGLDLEAILEERKTRLVALFEAAGIGYDVEALESDPAIILQQADAYREMLTLAAINDAVRAVMVAFAVGADLDQLAASYGVARFEDEADADFRRRVLLAPEAFAAAGPLGAYAFHALSAHPSVRNVDVWSPEPGLIEIAVQVREGDGAAPESVLNAVRARVRDDMVKPLTDGVSVRSVEVVPYAIAVKVFILPGPDPATVQANVAASLDAMAAARNTPSRDVPLSAVIAAAQVGAAERVVVIAPAADVAMARGQVALRTGISVSVEAIGV